MLKYIVYLLIFSGVAFSAENESVTNWILGPLNAWNNKTAWDPLPEAVSQVIIPKDAPSPDEKGSFLFSDFDAFVQNNFANEEVVGAIVKLLGRPNKIEVGTRDADRKWTFMGKGFEIKGTNENPIEGEKSYGSIIVNWDAGDKRGKRTYYPSITFIPFK